MRILEAVVHNFASYDFLKFSFEDRGLTLLSGPTGAGKSTLCDIIPWVLFGRTAKDGAVDEVIRWGAVDPTIGKLKLNHKGLIVEITRVRGKSRDNDLYYSVTDSAPIRGKDINDTQKILDDLLQLDIDLYLLGAYFHEFSQTSNFFTTTAKIRRSITEQIVDLSLAKEIAYNSSDYKKELKKQLNELSQTLTIKLNELTHIKKSIDSEILRAEQWNSSKELKLLELQQAKDNFDADIKDTIAALKASFLQDESALKSQINDHISQVFTKEAIESLRSALYLRKMEYDNSVCPACGSAKDSHKKLLVIKEENELKIKEIRSNQSASQIIVLEKQLERKKQALETAIGNEYNKTNTFASMLEKLLNERNPHSDYLAALKNDSSRLQKEIKDHELSIRDYTIEKQDLELLSEIIEDFRGLLIKNTIVDIENNTNRLLNDYFDAEIRVSFKMMDADKLEVSITKDGNLCTYTQLSKGQRQLLKCSFSVSVMRYISSYHSVNFSSVFLDEALDGLDESFKLKAFTLLKSLELEYESIFVVEHNEALKALFERQINIRLVNGASKIEEA